MRVTLKEELVAIDVVPLTKKTVLQITTSSKTGKVGLWNIQPSKP
jgi:hypothetical protein